MKTLEKGKDKVKEICDELRRETLEPAQEEAKRIIADAENERERIIQLAQREAETIIAHTRTQVDKERHIFNSSLEQASKQSLEALRQSIEHQLFHPEIADTLDKRMADPEIISKLVGAIITALEKDGLEANIQALIPKTASPEKINALLAKQLLDRLKEHSVKVGEFAGGVQVKLVDKKMTIDMSSQALVELLTRYLRDDFRQLFFKAE